MNLVDVKIEEDREHGRIAARRDRAAFVVPETQMRAEAAFPHGGLHCPIEYVQEAFWIFAIRVAAHRRLIDRDLLASSRDACFDFASNDRDERFGYRPTVGI